jgi:hypothetical protein
MVLQLDCEIRSRTHSRAPDTAHSQMVADGFSTSRFGLGPGLAEKVWTASKNIMCSKMLHTAPQGTQNFSATMESLVGAYVKFSSGRCPGWVWPQFALPYFKAC